MNIFYKFWMVINVANEYDNMNFEQPESCKIPKKDSPTMMYHYQEDAENELLRLQSAHPDGEFILLESTAGVRKTDSVFFLSPIECNGRQ